MLLRSLKFIVGIAIRVFFRRFTVHNKNYIPKKGPLLIVANHPNTFMDAAVIGTNLYQNPHFLVNASSFKNKTLRRGLNSMNAIPVMRKIDSQDGNINNDDMFAKCYEKLQEGASILIFPEGTSRIERKLRKLKTGAARIVLGAAKKYNFEIDIHILVIGLNYSNPRRFRSDLFMNVAPLIRVNDYKDAYLEDEQATVRALTDKITATLSEQIIITANEKKDLLLERIEEVYKQRLLKDLGWNKQDREDNFRVSQGLGNALLYFQEQAPDRVADLENRMDTYFHNLDQLRLNDGLFKDAQAKRRFWWESVFELLYLVIGFPIYIFGLLNNYIPYIIPSKVAYKITQYEGYIAPIMLFVGIFTFTIFYTTQTILLHSFVGIWWLTLTYLVLLPITGFFTLSYWQTFLANRKRWTLLAKFRKKADLMQEVTTQRQEILEILDQAQGEYLEVLEEE